MATFPYYPSIGHGAQEEVKEVMRVYDDRSYRRYRRSTALHKTFSCTFERLTQTKFDALVAFYRTHQQAVGSGNEFTFYDPSETTAAAPDPTGAASTGRHTAIFVSPFNWTRSGRCCYDVEVSVLFLT